MSRDRPGRRTTCVCSPLFLASVKCLCNDDSPNDSGIAQGSEQAMLFVPVPS